MSALTSPLLDGLGWVEHEFGTRGSSFTLSGVAQEALVNLKQIHSNVALVADRPSGCVGEGDALLTDRAGVAISIRTADCYPILLADPEHRAVAAIHAGWRGTAAGIVGETIARMRNVYGTRAEALYAAIGPGIGECCYEVGLEVARKFGKEMAGRLDLGGENRKQLIAAGVLDARIEAVGGCTYCDAARFHSFRRDGQRAGRMISFIRLQGV